MLHSTLWIRPRCRHQYVLAVWAWKRGVRKLEWWCADSPVATTAARIGLQPASTVPPPKPGLSPRAASIAGQELAHYRAHTALLRALSLFKSDASLLSMDPVICIDPVGTRYRSGFCEKASLPAISWIKQLRYFIDLILHKIN